MTDKIQIDAGPNGYVVALQRKKFVISTSPLCLGDKTQGAVLFVSPEAAYAVAEDLAITLERLGDFDSALLVTVLRCRSLVGETDKKWRSHVSTVMDRYGRFATANRFWGPVAGIKSYLNSGEKVISADAWAGAAAGARWVSGGKSELSFTKKTAQQRLNAAYQEAAAELQALKQELERQLRQDGSDD